MTSHLNNNVLYVYLIIYQIMITWFLVFSISDLFNGNAQYDEDKEHFLQLLP